MRFSVTEMCRVLREARTFWIWLLVAIAGALVSHILAKQFAANASMADTVRWTGMTYQVFGIFSVAIGLDKSRTLFGEKRLLYALISRIADTFRRRPAANFGGAAMSGEVAMQGHASIGVTGSGSPEERLAKLEEQLNQTHKELHGLRSQMKHENQQLNERLTKEAQERLAGDENTIKQLKEAVIGGIHLELAGLSFLLFGIIFATIPMEISNLVGM